MGGSEGGGGEGVDWERVLVSGCLPSLQHAKCLCACLWAGGGWEGVIGSVCLFLVAKRPGNMQSVCVHVCGREWRWRG